MNNNETSKYLEEVIFGSLLNSWNENYAVELLSKLNREDFRYYSNAYDTLSEAIEKKSSFITLLTTRDIKIANILKTSVGNKDFHSALEELKKVSLTIQYKQSCENFINSVEPRYIEQSIAELASKLNGVDLGINDKATAKEAIKEFDALQEEYQQKYKKGEKYLGIETGFSDMDNTIDGIQKGKLYVLGGTPGSGKTSFVINITNEFLKRGKRVIFFSLEMSSLEIVAKILSLRCDMNYLKILKGNLSDELQQIVEEEKAKLYEQDITIYDNMIDFDRVKLSIIKENMVKPIDFCVVDYLQLMGSSRLKTEFERMTAFPNELKVHICRKLNIPVMALSQINNESAKNPSDNMSGFKGSGAIEAAADVGMKLMNTEKREDRDLKKEQGLAINIDLLITKQRAGITKPIPMNFMGKTGRFLEGSESTLNQLIK